MPGLDVSAGMLAACGEMLEAALRVCAAEAFLGGSSGPGPPGNGARVPAAHSATASLQDKLSALAALQSAPADLDRFLNCLHKVQLHYPDICRYYMNHVRYKRVAATGRCPCNAASPRCPPWGPSLLQILFQLPRYQGDFRTMALEIVLSQADTTEGLFLSLQSKDLRGLLRHRYVRLVHWAPAGADGFAALTGLSWATLAGQIARAGSDDATQLTVLLILYKIAQGGRRPPSRRRSAGRRDGVDLTRHIATIGDAPTGPRRPGLTDTQIVYVLPTLVDAFPRHSNLKCRLAYYDLLAWLYDHRPTAEARLRTTWRVRRPTHARAGCPSRPLTDAGWAHQPARKVSLAGGRWGGGSASC